MNPLRPLLSLVLAATLCLSGLPSAVAAPARTLRSPSSAPASSAAARSTDTTPNVADNTVIVQFKDGGSAESLAEVYDAVDTSAGAVSVIRGDVLSFQVPAGETIIGFAEKLEGTGEVTYAEPNFVRTLAGYTPPAFVEPNDPAYLDTITMGYTNLPDKYPMAKSWWIRNVKAVEAWRKGYTGPDTLGKYPLRSDGTNFKVAVIDTGFYADHPDTGNMVPGSLDSTPVDWTLAAGKNPAEKLATVSHGTCVAGIIGAAAGNGEGTLGVANDTSVASYKVYDGGSTIADADIIAAILQAADDGCKVINMSLAGGDYNQALQDAIDYAWNSGCVIVAASGNDAVSTVSYPAGMNHVVAVGSLALDGSSRPKRSSFSNFGNTLDISAPGSYFWGLTKPGYNEDPNFTEPGYRWWDGTSMASPVVAGGIAWLWRAAPWMTNYQIVRLVEDTATDMGSAGRDDTFGYGGINLDSAYSQLIADYPLLKKPSVTTVSESNARNVTVKWTAVAGYAVTYDVTVDGVAFMTGTKATSVTLPYTTTVGSHVVTVSAKSPRNWTDGTETTTHEVHPAASFPEVTSLRYYRNKLLWSSTESTQPHTDTVSVDGKPAQSVTGDSWSTDSLSYGAHTATLITQDASGTASAPRTINFTVRPAPSVKRITGSDRYGYATALSRTEFTRASTAVLVSGASWTDALAAAPLAHLVRGPVLVASRTSLPRTTRTELARLGVRKIIIIGDTGDISSALRNSLARSYSVSRISGSDRYTKANAIARAIAKRSGGRVPGNKVVVVGDSYADAVAASAVAARKGWPLLYTRAASISSATRSTIRDIRATSSLVVGPGAKVSGAARLSLPASTRVSGASATEDTTLLARWATSHYPADFSGERLYLASSSLWTNGLGLPAAAAQKGTLVLATGYSLTTPVKNYYVANSEIAVTTRVIASSSTISNSTITSVSSIVGAP